MRMIGVILAGGLSSRMGNKMFLPVLANWYCVPLIDYQILWLLERGCEEIRVLLKRGSVLEAYLKSRYRSQIKLVYQDGDNIPVVEAIRLAVVQGELNVVVACDNVIACDEKLPDLTVSEQSCVTARTVPPWMHKHLDMFNKSWSGVSKTFPAEITGVQALTYPFLIREWSSDRSSLFDPKRDSVNFASWQGWYDIGTEESYIRYLESL